MDSIIKSLNFKTKKKNIFNTLVHTGSLKTKMGKKIKKQNYNNFINPQIISNKIKFNIIKKFIKKKSKFYEKMFNNIGVMQGRMVPSEKKNRIQYFPIKNWKKEMSLMAKNKIHKLEWTINYEKIKFNPLFDQNRLNEIIYLKKKLDIEIPSVTCDFFMEKPFFKKNNEFTLSILKKIIHNGKKLE